jgi:hypothetical protein
MPAASKSLYIRFSFLQWSLANRTMAIRSQTLCDVRPLSKNVNV